MPSILITGANRGLGLAFAKQYAAAGWRIHGCCRDPDTAGALNAVAAAAAADVSVHRLDVTDATGIAALAESLDSESLDVLLNNAGIYGGKNKGLGETDYSAWEETLRVNALGPMRMVEAFAVHVARSERKLVVCISSSMGSMAENTAGGAYAYRSSKGALNAVVRSLAADLAGRGVAVVAFHPGWVSTDMGGPSAPVTPAQSVHGMRAVIDGLNLADSGRFLRYDGAEIPW